MSKQLLPRSSMNLCMQLSLRWEKLDTMRKKSKDLETSFVNGLRQDRLFNDGAWTPSRFRSFVISALRTATRKWPAKFQTLKEANTGRRTNKKTGKLAYHYQCAGCRKEFVQSDIQVDHIFPVVDPQHGFQGWDTYIDRMFCEKQGLQVLCKTCHSQKTQVEKKEREKHAATKKAAAKRSRS